MDSNHDHNVRLRNDRHYGDDIFRQGVRVDKHRKMVTKMVKHYKPCGNAKIGYRLHIPYYAKRAERYTVDVQKDGTLTYTPVKS